MLFSVLPLLALFALADAKDHLAQAKRHQRLHKRDNLAISIAGSPSQCGESIVTITGGTGPWQVTALSGAGGSTILYLPPTDQEGVFRWTVDLQSGTAFVLEASDVGGDKATTAQMTIGSSSDATCLPGGSNAIGGEDDMFVWLSSVPGAPAAAATGGSQSSASPNGGDDTSSAAKGGAAAGGATPTSIAGSDIAGSSDSSAATSTSAGMSTLYVTATATPGASPDSSGAASPTSRVSLVAAILAGLVAFL